MKKKLIAIALITVFALTMSITAFAAQNGRGAGMGRGAGACGNQNGTGLGLGICGGGYALMWDADGNFVDRETFEANLDKAINDGLLSSAIKEDYLSMYDYCAEYGCGELGVRRAGGCGMRGAMWYYVP